ncbi:unnamed protein product [marine sediment metagenome]|uniref:Beta-galactosidase trimerisation domain-containing protein n=1 Tax=marine sediment metagenome TaxID=412755 RepID=X1LA86_9ZZZZ
MDLFFNAKPPQAEVGIVYNIYSYIMLTCSRERKPDIITSSLTGIYRALFEENIPVDFIHINDFAKGDLKNYKLIFMPFSIMMTSEIAEGVKEFVRQGGKLVAEVRPGWSDEKGQCSEVIPGLGLHKIFGCRERWIRERQKPKLIVELVGEVMPSLSRKMEVSGLVYEEALEPLGDSAKILAHFEDGSPAMIINSYGEGKAVLVGSLISGAYEKIRNEENGKFLKGLFKWAGVSPLVDIDGSGTEGRILEGGGYKLLLGFNHSGKKANISFRLQAPEGEYRIFDLLSQTKVNWSYENGLRIQRELEPQEICVLKIEQV